MKSKSLYDDSGQWMEFPAAGHSMGRLWRNFDRLLGELVPAAPVRWADVIIYELRGHMIAHRVVRTFKTGGRSFLVTKGDGNWLPDRIPVPVNQVRAVVRAVSTSRRLQLVDQGARRGIGWLHAVWGWGVSLIWRPLGSTD